MKKLPLYLLAIALPFTCIAAEGTAPIRPDVEELLSVSRVESLLADNLKAVEEMISTGMSQQMSQQFAGQPELLAKQKEIQSKAIALLKEGMSWAALKGDFAKIYADTFSEEEIKGLIAFYKSPVGQAFVTKQPELMRGAMEVSQKRMMEMMPKLQALMESELAGLKEAAEKQEKK